MKVKRFGLVEVRGGWIPFWAPRLLAAPYVEKLRRCFNDNDREIAARVGHKGMRRVDINALQYFSV